MINEKQAHKYCSDDISTIENYDKAIADSTLTWDCHHKLEIQGCFLNSPLLLKQCGLYYNVPALQLVFLKHGEHKGLHNSSKPGTMLGKKHSENAKHKMSLSHKGKSAYWNIGNNYWLGRQHTEESKKKISKTRKGKPSWNKGIRHNVESIQKMRLSHVGKHWWNNGVVEVNQVECPAGFVKGRLKCN